MTIIEQFIERVDRLEERYKRDKYTQDYLMSRKMMVELQDELKHYHKPAPPPVVVTEGPLFDLTG